MGNKPCYAVFAESLPFLSEVKVKENVKGKGKAKQCLYLAIPIFPEALQKKNALFKPGLTITSLIMC